MTSYKLNTDGSFLSPDEIVADLLKRRFTSKERKYFMTAVAIDLHFGFGTWIRNSYGLWELSNPHVKGHPNDFSVSIIESFLKEFRRSLSTAPFCLTECHEDR